MNPMVLFNIRCNKLRYCLNINAPLEADRSNSSKPQTMLTIIAEAMKASKTTNDTYVGSPYMELIEGWQGPLLCSSEGQVPKLAQPIV